MENFYVKKNSPHSHITIKINLINFVKKLNLIDYIRVPFHLKRKKVATQCVTQLSITKYLARSRFFPLFHSGMLLLKERERRENSHAREDQISQSNQRCQL